VLRLGRLLGFETEEASVLFIGHRLVGSRSIEAATATSRG